MIVRWHFAYGGDWWTLCGTYWADAVNTTTDLLKVNCPRCLTRWEDQRSADE